MLHCVSVLSIPNIHVDGTSPVGPPSSFHYMNQGLQESTEIPASTGRQGVCGSVRALCALPLLHLNFYLYFSSLELGLYDAKV